MRRREFIAGLSAAMWPCAARAQADRLKRVGWAAAGDPESLVFPRELAKLGWVEGRNLQLDFRPTFSNPDEMRAKAAELVSMAPDLLVIGGTPMTAIFKQLTSTVPIVFVIVSDPIASGFVESFARPGGNITGFISSESSLSGKWLSLLKNIAPNVANVLVLYDPRDPSAQGLLRTIEAASPVLQVNLHLARVTEVDDLTSLIEGFAPHQNGGIVVLPSLFLSNNRATIATLAARHRLPSVYPRSDYANVGGLASYAPDFGDLWRRAAGYADLILKGAKPADLPVQAPIRFKFGVNLKTAKAFGLTIPETVLATADEVIE
jgi:putative ABC transport system substrate-binding protein